MNSQLHDSDKLRALTIRKLANLLKMQTWATLVFHELTAYNRPPPFFVGRNCRRYQKQTNKQTNKNFKFLDFVPFVFIFYVVCVYGFISEMQDYNWLYPRGELDAEFVVQAGLVDRVGCFARANSAHVMVPARESSITFSHFARGVSFQSTFRRRAALARRQ